MTAPKICDTQDTGQQVDRAASAGRKSDDSIERLEARRTQLHRDAGVLASMFQAHNLAFCREPDAGLDEAHLEKDPPAHLPFAAYFQVHAGGADVARHGSASVRQ